MKTVFNLSYIIVALLFIAVSCSPNEDENPTVSVTAGFKWRENSETAAEKTAGSSEVRSQYSSIFAFSGTTPTSGTLFEINLTAVSPGTYAIGGNNAFYFNGNTTAPSSGEVVISSNSGGKASGTFKAFWGSGSITVVYGSFTDIPVQ